MSSFSQANVSQFIVNNAKQIGGVIGTLLSLVSVPESYQIAVSVVAAGPLNSITNNVGRATFLPLDTLNPSKIQGPQRTVIEQMPGFIGFASELVSIKGEYQVALDYVLGTIVVVDTYDSAVAVAKGTNNRFNIVTLTGERILPHGAVIGGSIGRSTNLFENKTNKASDLEDAKLIIEKLEEKEKEQLNELSNEYRLLTGASLIEDEESNVNDSESIKLSRAIAKLEVERDDIQIRINSLSASRNKTVDRQKEINETNSEKRKELDALKDANSTITAELQVMQTKNIAIIERLATGQEVYDLSMELKDIGSVNLDSIEEYKQEKERFDYYDAQLQELNEAISKLESIILDIDISMETQFKKVVDDVNLALPDAFTKLFGGGTARLIYTDPENILETGIDIQVNPPGKKISNLNLLSGGEKSLVALSVLFSILKVRPLPLVILDEAEAPLDPSNVERFAKYVKQFTANTQFIIVTHREGTMENCDVLFGVTMQTKGITKIVKIKLVEAQNMALNIQNKEINI
ncbi:hypothetical protein FQA39_LY12937 [Lamprigera yunnana]|nr:hypothetical protein FQA39_LY12937 [Lamprigera yunnana]